MLKILLVEDNEMNRDMLSRRLISRGFEIVIAMDGMEALIMAQDETPDLIVLDMGLPKLDGYQVAAQLKAGATHLIPILGLSAHAMEGDRERALLAGCDDYDTKPVDIHRLMEKITTLLQAKSSHAND